MKLVVRFALLAMLLAGTARAQTEADVDTSAVMDTTAMAQPAPTIAPPAPVTDLQAKDTDNDHGHSIGLSWTPSVDAAGPDATVLGYVVYRWVPALMDSAIAAQRDRDSLYSLVQAYKSAIPRAEVTLDHMRDRNAPADSIQMLTDSLAVMKANDEAFPDRIDALEASAADMWDRVAAAHQQYPDNGRWDSLGVVGPQLGEYTNVGSKYKEDAGFLPDHTDYRYRVVAMTSDPAVRTIAEVGPIQSRGQWYNTGRSAVLAGVLVFGLLTVYFVRRARSGAELYVRPLGGIEAVDEAIGRATEMGKPILYVLGLGTASDIATIASLTILGRVAKKVAEFQTQLIVPTYDPIVMSVAEETVKAAYMDAGRPDFYKQDIVFFVTQNQFAYVSAVNGIMLRQLPATNLYLGKFYAESLILAETGALAGSIQISGTDEVAQIPFFVVACDYTLIGEELYAASAYLGREPVLLGSLKAQDYAKAAIIVLAIIGAIAVNIAASGGVDWLAGFKDLFKVAN